MPFRARSLRLKLALWFVLVFFLIQAILVGAVVFLRREMLQSSLDTALTHSAEAMVDNVLAAEVQWKEEHLFSLVPADAGFLLYAIRDDDGRVLVSSGVSDADDLPFSAWEVVPAGPVGGVHTVIGPEKARELTDHPQKLRLVTLPFRHDEQLYYFQAGVRDQAIERLLGPFFDLVLIGVPVGVVAATIAAWVIAGRAVSPIDRISKAARDVSPMRLNERFQVPTTDEEVQRLEGELNAALERLEAGYRAQDQFISNVSHELKTPVAALLTQAQVAKMGRRSLKKAYTFIERAEVLLKRLGKVVESFLVLARADVPTSLSRTSVSVIDIVLECLHSCKEAAEQNQVRLIPSLTESGDESDLTIMGDPDLLQTLVENLVHNAICHSPPEGEVTIDARSVGGSLRIIVRDQGPGIPEEYLERVFERFVQVPRDNFRGDGTGLGLAIAHGIAQVHGGTIGVRNNEGAGCSFTVTLPVGDPIAPDREAPTDRS